MFIKTNYKMAGVLKVLLTVVFLGSFTTAHAQAAPQITLSATQLIIGDVVEVRGSGFPADSPVSIGLGRPGQPVGGDYGGTFTDAQGSFQFSVMLQNNPDNSPLQPGPVTLVARADGGRVTASAGLTLLLALKPTLTLDPTTGPSGTILLAKGRDFPPNQPLNIGIGPPNSEFAGSYAQATSAADGSFEVTFPLAKTPNGQPLPPGLVIVAAHNQTYSFVALANFTVTPASIAAQGGMSGPPTMPGSVPAAGVGGGTAQTATGGLPVSPLLILTLVLVASSILLKFRLVKRGVRLE